MFFQAILVGCTGSDLVTSVAPPGPFRQVLDVGTLWSGATEGKVFEVQATGVEGQVIDAIVSCACVDIQVARGTLDANSCFLLTIRSVDELEGIRRQGPKEAGRSVFLSVSFSDGSSREYELMFSLRRILEQIGTWRIPNFEPGSPPQVVTMPFSVPDGTSLQVGNESEGELVVDQLESGHNTVGLRFATIHGAPLGRIAGRLQRVAVDADSRVRVAQWISVESENNGHCFWDRSYLILRKGEMQSVMIGSHTNRIIALEPEIEHPFVTVTANETPDGMWKVTATASGSMSEQSFASSFLTIKISFQEEIEPELVRIPVNFVREFLSTGN